MRKHPRQTRLTLFHPEQHVAKQVGRPTPDRPQLEHSLVYTALKARGVFPELLGSVEQPTIIFGAQPFEPLAESGDCRCSAALARDDL